MCAAAVMLSEKVNREDPVQAEGHGKISMGIVYSVSQSGETEGKSVRTVGSQYAVQWRACARPSEGRIGVSLVFFRRERCGSG